MPYRELFLLQANPIKAVFLDEFLKNEKLRKKYRGCLKSFVDNIRRKQKVNIENVSLIGYLLKKD